MQARTYEILLRAIELGIEVGFNRAHKHGEPEPETIKEKIEQAILEEIHQVFHFTENE